MLSYKTPAIVKAENAEAARIMHAKGYSMAGDHAPIATAKEVSKALEARKRG